MNQGPNVLSYLPEPAKKLVSLEQMVMGLIQQHFWQPVRVG